MARAKEVRIRNDAPVRLMSEAEGYVMVRHKGAAPFVLSAKEWQALPPAEPKAETAQIDPVEIYKHGRGFFTAIDHFQGLISATPAIMPQLACPILVLSAFSSEVFLKCLVCIETGNSPHGHELDKLFGNLSTGTQSRIEAKWNAIMVLRESDLRKLDASLTAPVPRDLRAVLTESSKTFEQVRYIYEPGPDFRSFISDLPMPLIETIWQLRPSWKAI